jgi:hypothetical protein
MNYIARLIGKLFNNINGKGSYSNNRMEKYRNRDTAVKACENSNESTCVIAPEGDIASVNDTRSLQCSPQKIDIQYYKINDEEPTIKLSFSDEELRKAVIYSEILAQPKAKGRRRCKRWN